MFSAVSLDVPRTKSDRYCYPSSLLSDNLANSSDRKKTNEGSLASDLAYLRADDS